MLCATHSLARAAALARGVAPARSVFLSRRALHRSASLLALDENMVAKTTGASSTDGSSSTPRANRMEWAHADLRARRQRLLRSEEECLSPAEQHEKERLIEEITRRLTGGLADEAGRVPTGDARPIAIEVDGPVHFYANSTAYTAYTKLKHRLITRMGYKLLHVPYFEWRRLRGAKEREEYLVNKLNEEPSEWLDRDDEEFYRQQLAEASSARERHRSFTQLDAQKDTIVRRSEQSLGSVDQALVPPAEAWSEPELERLSNADVAFSKMPPASPAVPPPGAPQEVRSRNPFGEPKTTSMRRGGKRQK